MENARSSSPEGQKLPPNRSFGLIFCGVFALVAVFPVVFGGSARIWSAIVSAVFGLAALCLPWALTPLNRVWMRFGALLHRVVSPIVLAFLFFGLITPFGVVMRILGKNPLKLRFEPVQTYWIDREPPGPEPQSLKNQF